MKFVGSFRPINPPFAGTTGRTQWGTCVAIGHDGILWSSVWCPILAPTPTQANHALVAWSADAGATWHRHIANAQPTTTTAQAFAVGGTNVYVATYTTADILQISHDAGATWAKLTTVTGPRWGTGRLPVLAARGTWAASVSHRGFGGVTTTWRVTFSTNGGRTWTHPLSPVGPTPTAPTRTLYGPPVQFTALIAINARTVVMIATTSFWISHDKGVSWTKVNTAAAVVPATRKVAKLAGLGSAWVLILVDTHNLQTNQFLVSQDTGAHWKLYRSFLFTLTTNPTGFEYEPTVATSPSLVTDTASFYPTAGGFEWGCVWHRLVLRPPLFIPRKDTGGGQYVTRRDYGIDMRAIETWAAIGGTPLFIPRKDTGGGQYVTRRDYGIDMRAIETWAATVGGGLFIPRKDAGTSEYVSIRDYGIDMRAIETWADR